MKAGMRIEGVDKTDATLRRLEGVSRKGVAERALLAGAHVLAAEAKRLVRVDEGELRDDITVSNAAEGATRSEPAAYVGPTSKTDWRAHFEEFGTVDQAAHPFIRPAFDGSAARQAKRAIAEVLATEIDKQVG
jgi:HK97 gp10 family phage protein